jgi:hypothetical protein
MSQSSSILPESRKDFRHMLTPLRNHPTPERGQNREIVEQGKQPVAWSVTEKHTFG